jgi:hypothetical protein
MDIVLFDSRDVPDAIPDLPNMICNLYVASGGRAFSVDRFAFRRTADMVTSSTKTITFADEHRSSSQLIQWMYHRIDGIVQSTHDDCMTPQAFVDMIVQRARRQKAEDYYRYAEKCVDGEYVASPVWERPIMDFMD